MKDHLYVERYVLAHEAYKKAIWSRAVRPACFEDSDDAIVLQHNRDLGAAFAAFQKDLNVQYAEVIRMEKASNLREKRIASLEERIKKQSNTIRVQGEKLKLLRELSA